MELCCECNIYQKAEMICKSFMGDLFVFTETQKYMLNHPSFWDTSKNLLIKGAPASGKTLLAEILMLLHSRVKTLYLVPYKALLNEKYLTFVKHFPQEYIILRSSGDYYDMDDKIFEGKCDIAVMIYEKLENYLHKSEDSNSIFLKYDLIVMDEYTIIREVKRGIVIEKILHSYVEIKNSLTDLKAHMARIVALTVPECANLSHSKIEFVNLYYDSRPVKLNEAIINIENGSLCSKENNHWPISFEFKDEVRRYEILERVVLSHLQLNHKVFVFINDKAQVRTISFKLARNLAQHFRPNDWFLVLKKIKFELGDEAFGIINEKFMEAAKFGFISHNADYPPKLKNIIENEFRNPAGQLKVIVTTETLGFGINSYADVVIFYSNTKPADEFDHLCIPSYATGFFRFLDKIEYRNYSGRAARVYSADDYKHEGYSYLLARDEHVAKIMEKRYFRSKFEINSSSLLEKLIEFKKWVDAGLFILSIIDIYKVKTFDEKNIMSIINNFTRNKTRKYSKEANTIIKKLLKAELIEVNIFDTDQYFVTRLGDTACQYRISEDLLKFYMKTVKKAMEGSVPSMFQLLFGLCRNCSEIDSKYKINRSYSNLKEYFIRALTFVNHLKSRGEIVDEHLIDVLKKIQTNLDSYNKNEFGYCEVDSKSCLFIEKFAQAQALWLWADGVLIQDISNRYLLTVNSGYIRNILNTILYLLGAMINICETFKEGNVLCETLSIYQKSLKAGLPECLSSVFDKSIPMGIRTAICELRKQVPLDNIKEKLVGLMTAAWVNDSMDESQIAYFVEQFRRENL